MELVPWHYGSPVTDAPHPECYTFEGRRLLWPEYRGGNTRMRFVRSYAIYGTFGLVSGFLTPHLSDGLRAVLPEWTIIEVPISLWLAGVAFGLALAAATACVLVFQPRQLLFIPYVLAGWFCAVQICLRIGADEPKAYAQSSTITEDFGSCEQLDRTEPLPAARTSDRECFEIVPAIARAEPGSLIRYWRSVSAYFVAGAVGALITALGIPIATRCFPAPRTYLAITLTGALVATVWFVIAGAIAALRADQNWYALFVPWQAAIALAIGRSIGPRT